VRSACGRCVEAFFGLADTTELSSVCHRLRRYGDVAMMRRLLEHGAVPSAGLLTSLVLTPETFPDDLVASVIAHGANINADTSSGAPCSIWPRQETLRSCALS
jgi:hypothetical protein